MNVRQFKLVGLGIGISMLMLTHVPGYFLSMEMSTAHLIQMLGTFLVAYFYMLDKIPLVSTKEFRKIYLVFLIVSACISLNYRATDQFLMLVMAFFVIVGGLIYGVFKKNLDFGIRFNLLVVLTIAFFDVYRGQAYREGYANLAGLVIIVVIFEIINIVRNVYQINLNTRRIEGNLESERILLQKINSSNEHLKSIIHDLKAPITSLNFALQPEIINKSRILLISQRFDKIFEALSNDKSNTHASWYSVKTIAANLEEVCLGMDGLFREISIKVADNCEGDVFYFIEDFKNASSEILMNSYNAAVKNSVPAEVSIKVECLANNLKIYFIDKSGGVNQRILKNLSERGVSTGKSGLGLWMIRNRLSEVGGGITFANKGNGLEVCITYLKQARGISDE
jgi:signal transduction histidine kinase